MRLARSALLVLGSAFAGSLVALACGDDRQAFKPEVEVDTPSLTGDGSVSEPADVDAGLCLSETLGAVPVPLAMLLVMDRSGSMSSSTTPTRWDMARQAMIAFADTPGAAGSKLGLTVFPPDPESGADQCLPSSYAPIVPIALLPGNGVAIKDALLSRKTTGSTPMRGALQGGVDAMKAFLTDNPNEEGVIILVTDGDPGACTGDTVSNVVSVAQAGATGTPRVRTFVVGMEGATFSNLDSIAQAGGGAPKAFNASGATTDAGTPQAQLLAALDAIRSGALGCEYIVPTPEASQGTVDPTSVTIDFTPGKNDPSQKFARVENEQACGATTGGFYYDDPKAPRRIILCPASCEAVRKGTAEAKVDVTLGCIKQVK